MYISDQDIRLLYKLRLLAPLFLIVSPVIYLVLAYSLSGQMSTAVAGNELLVRSLLLIAIAQPLILPVIGRSQIRCFKRQRDRRTSPARVFFMLNVIKLAFIDSIFLYGVAVLLLTHELKYLLYFYPVGIGWSFVYWPRQSRFEKFLKEMEES